MRRLPRSLRSSILPSVSFTRRLQSSKLWHLGDAAFAAAAPGAHTPRLFEGLQKAGVREPARSLICVAADDAAEVVDVTVSLPGQRWQIRVIGCRPASKRLNETWPEAALRCAKHAAAHRLLLEETFQAALRQAELDAAAAKYARAQELRAASLALPTMTDVVLQQYVDSGRFAVRCDELSAGLLAEMPTSAAFGLDVEGFDAEREDWPRPWLIQLAFQRKPDIHANALDTEGEVLVLIAREDEALTSFSKWMASAAESGSDFYLFDRTHDLNGIFRAGQVPQTVQERSFDLKKFGTSLHAVAGQRLFNSELRKHERLSESLAFLPDTKGVTETQVRYAAADAIVTLVLGMQLFRCTDAAS